MKLQGSALPAIVLHAATEIKNRLTVYASVFCRLVASYLPSCYLKSSLLQCADDLVPLHRRDVIVIKPQTPGNGTEGQLTQLKEKITKVLEDHRKSLPSDDERGANLLELENNSEARVEKIMMKWFLKEVKEAKNKRDLNASFKTVISHISPGLIRKLKGCFSPTTGNSSGF